MTRRLCPLHVKDCGGWLLVTQHSGLPAYIFCHGLPLGLTSVTVLFPDHWEKFIESLPAEDRNDPLAM